MKKIIVDLFEVIRACCMMIVCKIPEDEALSTLS